MARSFTPELGIRIRISDSKANWLGTRAQLEAEGFVPAGTVWPDGKRYARFEIAKAFFCIYRVACDGTAPNTETLYRIHHYGFCCNDKTRRIAKKLQEAMDIAAIGGKEWTAAYRKHREARSDDAFQDFKNKLLGLKKRGRPAKNTATPSTQSQGASA